MLNHEIFPTNVNSISLLRCISLFAIICAFTHVCAQAPLRRPTVGLVLSGGGAKGLAHIGAISVLDSLGIPVDCIAGTSMGSIVGGLYAMGYSAQEMAEIVRQADWDVLLNDATQRRDISIEEKDEDGRYIGVLPIVRNAPALPRGVIRGSRISILLSSLSWHVHQINNFDSLPIPFRCIATDLATMTPVVLDSGFLPDALRASMAIPSVFTPMELDGRLLVDGGLVRNIPAIHAREMGADIVICVDVTADPYKKEELTDAYRIMDQAVSFQMAPENERQRCHCDILIKPALDAYSTSSFGASDTLISLGYLAGLCHLAELRNLADSLAAFQEPPRTLPRPQTLHSIYINEIRVVGLSRVSQHVVYGNLQIREKSWVTLRQLEKAIARVYGSQFFEQVSYRILPGSEGAVLTVRVVEQPCNFVKFGVNYQSDFHGAVLLNATLRNVLGEGSRLLADLRLGTYPAAKLHYSIQTPWKPNLGISTRLQGGNYRAYDYDADNELIGEYEYIYLSAEQELRASLSNSLMLGVGLRGELFELEPRLSLADSVDLDASTLAAFFRLRFDRLDRLAFPRRGAQLSLDVAGHFAGQYAGETFWSRQFVRLMFDYTQHYRLGKRISLHHGFFAGHNSGENTHPVFYAFLGRTAVFDRNVFPFTGLRYMGVHSESLAGLRTGFQYEFVRNKYLLLRGNAAFSGDTPQNMFHSDALTWGAGFGVGMGTLVGPVELIFSYGNRSNGLMTQFCLGYAF